MSELSCIRVSYNVTKTIRCHCSSYKFPHKWGFGECRSSIIDNPPSYSAPRRGLASKLDRVLDAYSGSENELIDELINLLRQT